MSTFDEATVIGEYTLQQAIEDGVLVEIFKDRWPELSGGKPIVATAHLFEEVSLLACWKFGTRLWRGENM